MSIIQIVIDRDMKDKGRDLLEREIEEMKRRAQGIKMIMLTAMTYQND